MSKSCRTFHDVAKVITQEKKKTLSPAAYSNMEIALRCHLLPFFGKMKVDKITINTVNTYFSKVMNHRRVSDDIKYIKQILRYAFYEGMLNRLFVIRNPDPAPSAGKYITKKELFKLLSACKNESLKLQIIMGYTMGMRRSEICHCRWEFIDLERAEITLPSWFLKTRRMSDRVIPIPDLVLKMLKKRTKTGLFLFESRKNKGMSILDNKAIWRRLKESCGIDVRFHDLRHSCITNLVRRNVHVLRIRQMCGVSPQVMKRYTHVPIEDLRHDLEDAFKAA